MEGDEDADDMSSGEDGSRRSTPKRHKGSGSTGRTRRNILPRIMRGQRCGHCHTCLNPKVSPNLHLNLDESQAFLLVRDRTERRRDRIFARHWLLVATGMILGSCYQKLLDVLLCNLLVQLCLSQAFDMPQNACKLITGFA